MFGTIPYRLCVLTVRIRKLRSSGSNDQHENPADDNTSEESGEEDSDVSNYEGVNDEVVESSSNYKYAPEDLEPHSGTYTDQ